MPEENRETASSVSRYPHRRGMGIILPVAVTLLLFVLAIFGVLLPAVREAIMHQRRCAIRDLANTAWTLLAHYEERVERGELTRAEARARAADRLRDIRYGEESKEYFWITTLESEVVMHPYRPDLQGQDLTDYTDRAGKRFVAEFSRVARTKGEGYVDYVWQMHDDPEQVVPKIGYVKLFEPWGWVVGTGMYIEDVRREVASLTRRTTGVAVMIVFFSGLVALFVIQRGSRLEAARSRAERELARHRDHLEELVAARTRELEAAQDELVRREKLALLGQLTADVAHELRNPLGTIQTSLYTLKGQVEGGEGRTASAIERAERNIRRCDRIIQELLDTTRNTPPELRPIELDPWLAAQLDEEPPPRNVTLHRRLDSGVVIEVDEERLRRCVLNILTNAYQAAAEQRDGTAEVTVATAAGDGRAQITIADSGKGMPDDVRQRLFEPLFSTRSFGVGLGLTVARQIIEQHGGGIEVESEENRGTTVLLWLPIHHQDKTE